MEIPSSFQITRDRVNKDTVADIKSVIATSKLAPFFKLRLSKQLGNDATFTFWWPATTDQDTVIDVFHSVEDAINVTGYICYNDKEALEINALDELPNKPLSYLEIESPDLNVSWRHDPGGSPPSEATIESHDPTVLVSSLAQMTISRMLSPPSQSVNLRHIVEDFRGVLVHEMIGIEQEWF